MQVLVLPVGKYVLSTIARTSSTYEGPEPVRLQFTCGSGRPLLATLSLSEVSMEWTRQSVEFTRPQQTGCDTQLIMIENGFQTLSWRDRYRGHLDVALVRIERIR